MSEYKEQLIELFENVSGCSIDEFSEEQLPYLADYIIGQQEADNMCIAKLKKENQRLTAIATNHATRADEFYDALESTNKELYFLINELNKYKTKDVRCDQLDPPELHDMETCHLNAVLLDKSRIEAEKGDGICN